MTFRRFIAIDWSGAKGPGYPGIAVAECAPGRAAPVLAKPPSGRRWRRRDVAEWLSVGHDRDGPIFVGLDFAFALPWEPGQGYFPGTRRGLDRARELWALVDRVSREGDGTDDLDAGPFVEDPRFAPLFWKNGPRPAAFHERFRLTERLSPVRPECVFKLIGPRQVGKGSLSGMRLLHRLKERHGHALSIWPFEAVEERSSVLADIFPRLFLAMTGHARGKVRTLVDLNHALQHFDSDRATGAEGSINDHESDALISAAALRHIAGLEGMWNPALMTRDVARREGWIFGVR